MIITFDEEKHKYTDENTQNVPSVSHILGEVYGTGLENAPTFFVNRAANKGHFHHDEFHVCITTGKKGETPEFNAWYKWYKEQDFKDVQSEQIVFAVTPYGNFAGTADLLADKRLRDYKTCKTATRQQISKWQMQTSMYHYAYVQMGYEVENEAEIIHVNGNNLEVIKVPYLGDCWVEETMRLYAAGETPKEETYELETVSKKELQTLEDVLLQMDALQLVIDEYRKKALEEMERRGILNIQVGKVKMTYVPRTVRATFDSKSFKAAEPDLYEKYIKKTEVKPSLRITVK